MKNNFGRKEKLKGEKAIARLFTKGNALINHPIKINWNLEDFADDSQIKVLFACPKKNFKNATDRNVIKRRMRESYRLSKTPLISLCRDRNVQIALSFLYIGKTSPDFKVINDKITSSLQRLLKEIEGIN